MEKELRSALRRIYSQALAAVEPEGAVRRLVSLREETLLVGPHRFPLRGRGACLIGAGKAGVPMARSLEKLLGGRLRAGLVVVKYGHGGELSRTRVLEGGHPEPDEAGRRAAREMLAFVREHVRPDDLLLVVISGGGSALLPAPVTGVSLEEKRRVTELLLKSEADIHEINAIRKHLSRIKGGRLLEHVPPGAEVVALLLSDVVGDDPGSIASGPTAPDPTTFADCNAILDRLGLGDQLPPAVSRYLRSAEAPETPKPGDPLFARVVNLIVGSNARALEAAAAEASRLGFGTLILGSDLCGDTAQAARSHVELARRVLGTGRPVERPCCLISGGETTLRVRGAGKGGRNQEFVLHCAGQIAGWDDSEVLFASLGSDGTDGPTEAAGALATPATAARGRALGMEIDDFLSRNDSYHYFKALDDLIVTGPTQTNVMDLRFVLIA